MTGREYLERLQRLEAAAAGVVIGILLGGVASFIYWWLT